VLAKLLQQVQWWVPCLGLLWLQQTVAEIKADGQVWELFLGLLLVLVRVRQISEK